MDHPPSSPPHPPLTAEDWLIWLRLLRSRRVGPTTFHRLVAEYGSAAAALDALPGVARDAGVTDYITCPPEVAAGELRRARLAGAVPIAYGTAAYPASLMDLPDAPPILWARGDLSLLARPRVALVGARNASSLGLRCAKSLAAGLGRTGIATVSGFARGIDTEVHKATLETGTIAVFAGGVDVIYPTENAVLAQELGECGLIVSEQPVGLRPQARHFPSRNRLISGLSGAVVVIEAAAKSGSLLTARDALDQGREVLAVPGHPFDARAAGCNLLIRDGATLVRGPQDVIEALDLPQATPPARKSSPSPPAEPGSTRPRATLQDTHALHRRILDRLGPAPSPEDTLVRDLDVPTATLSRCLTTLEMEGRISRDPGGLLRRLDA